MQHDFWNAIVGWGWLLWCGVLLLLLSSFGNWRSTRAAYRKSGSSLHGAALDILNERYASRITTGERLGQVRLAMATA